MRECERLGRDPAEVELSVQLIIPPDGEPRRAATQAAIDYGRAGASHILLTPLGREGAPGIRQLATEVAVADSRCVLLRATRPQRSTFSDDLPWEISPQ